MSDASTSDQFEELLAFIRDARGFDLTGYKRTSLGRRIRKRMQDIGASSYSDYRDLLETHAEEYVALFNTILINVTGFFRDSDAWQALRTEVVDTLLEGREDQDEIRVWSAGCSSGEEPYSLAMSFAEAMGADRFNDRVKIYATDIDEEALATARKGIYSQKSVETVPEELRDKYFEATPTGAAFRPELRRKVIFGRLDVTRDAPISRLDLLVCRNTLMYFNAETQSQALSRFHFALREVGYLFLGKAEMLMTDGSRFIPLDPRFRIFRRRLGVRMPLQALAPVDLTSSLNVQMLRHRQLRDLATNIGPVAQMLIGADGDVVLINNQARGMFGLTGRDEGRPLRDLELSYRPVELRSLIEQAQTERRVIRVNAVERSHGAGETQFLDVQVHPMFGEDSSLLGTAVLYLDSTAFVRLQQEVKGSREELETAYEELQSTNEELETMNEELQSSVEELETTNEELQSTNEELETTNEELQSSNEELETMNEELRTRTAELDEVNAYLATVLSSVPFAVVVLDDDLRVRSWNSSAEELWGLRSNEVLGASFFGLEFGLPVGRLRGAVRACLDGTSTEETVEVEGVNRRGQTVVCSVVCSALAGEAGAGVVLLMNTRRQ
jgi:two-component system CheB/CheR fusion protein